ncbi:MAG: ABC transporter permease [Chitinophagales bacterium]
MKQLIVFIRKEFLHVFRDRKSLLMLFGLPVTQIILFGFALSSEIRDSRIVICDYSKDEVTRKIIEKIEASRYFDIEENLQSAEQLESAFKKGSIKMAVIFPANFAEDLTHTNKATVQVIADASDPNQATAITAYISQIVQDYNLGSGNISMLPLQIVPEVRMLYNPELRGAPNFVPGVMALVLMLVCTMMTSVAIVREKELGTMEVLLVSPFKPAYIIISKLTPYLMISIMNLFIILAMSSTLLDLEIKGNLFLLVFESILFILTSLSIGLYISINAETQQAAMMTSLLGMMLPTLLLTGFMFPVENMPLPLQWMANAVPSRWFFIIIKRVMLKGLGFGSVWKETLILLGMTLFLFAISLKKFKTRLE